MMMMMMMIVIEVMAELEEKGELPVVMVVVGLGWRARMVGVSSMPF